MSKLLIVLLSFGTVDGLAESAPSALRCGTPYLLQAMDAASELSTEHQRLKLVQRRPSTQHSLLTPSGHFRVHYDTEGSDAVDPTDDDANGIPDYIDLAATVLDSTWELEVEQLGYNPPPSDNGLGGGEEYDVYVIDLAHRGCSVPFTATPIPDRTKRTHLLWLHRNRQRLYRSQLRTDSRARRPARDHRPRVPPRHSVWLLRRERRLLVA